MFIMILCKLIEVKNCLFFFNKYILSIGFDMFLYMFICCMLKIILYKILYNIMFFRFYIL